MFTTSSFVYLFDNCYIIAILFKVCYNAKNMISYAKDILQKQHHFFEWHTTFTPPHCLEILKPQPHHSKSVREKIFLYLYGALSAHTTHHSPIYNVCVVTLRNTTFQSFLFFYFFLTGIYDVKKPYYDVTRIASNHTIPLSA